MARLAQCAFLPLQPTFSLGVGASHFTGSSLHSHCQGTVATCPLIMQSCLALDNYATFTSFFAIPLRAGEVAKNVTSLYLHSSVNPAPRLHSAGASTCGLSMHGRLTQRRACSGQGRQHKVYSEQSRPDARGDDVLAARAPPRHQADDGRRRARARHHGAPRVRPL